MRKRTKARLLHRLGAWALALCLVAGLLPGTAFAAGTDTGKAIQLGSSAITTGDMVYYGNGLRWKVLSTNGNGGIDYVYGTNHVDSSDVLFLFSEKELFKTRFCSYDHYTNEYTGSTLRSDLSSKISEYFSAAEQSAILKTKKEAASTVVWCGSNATNPIINDDQLFALSAEEMQTYLGYDKDDPSTWTAGLGGDMRWWLRSAIGNSFVGTVAADGQPSQNSLNSAALWVRPAFNLNLNAVLFISAPAAKVDIGMDSGLAAVDSHKGNWWKLTLLDSTRSFSVTENSLSAAAGGTVTVNYSGAQTGGNECVSAMICDGNNVLYYGNIAQNSESGEATVNIPSELAAGDYTLKVFSEQLSGNYRPDYASAFQNIALTVTEAGPAVTDVTVSPAKVTVQKGKTQQFTATVTGEEGCDQTVTWITKYSTSNGTTISADGLLTVATDETASAFYVRAVSKANDEIYGAAFVVVDPHPHNFEQVVRESALKSPATCTEAAVYYYSCTLCGELDKSQDFIPSTPLGHDYGDWVCDKENHWRECSRCGDKSEIAGHTYNTGVNVCVICDWDKSAGHVHQMTEHPATSATCTEDGNKQHYTCSLCDGKAFWDQYGTNPVKSWETVVIPAAGHTGDWEHDENQHWRTCGTCGTREEGAHQFVDGICSICHYESTTEPEPGPDPEPGHTHSWSDTWSSDAAHHWHECTAEGCPVTGNSQKDDYGAHVYTNDADTTCDTCGYVRQVASTEFTITFDGNGGSSPASQTTVDGKLTSLPTSTRSGYNFLGWYTAASGGTAVTTSTVFTADDTLYAHWSRSSSGGGSGSSGSTTYVPSVDAGRNGDVTVSPSRPSSGQTVTITVDPDAGYELDDLTVTDARGNVVKVTDNGDGTYSFTQPSSKVTIEATFAEIQEEPALAFTDVTERGYYYDAVLWAVENGITSGTTAATFSPDANVSRTQMVTFLWRAAGSPEPQSSVNPFTDISSSAYYYDAVLWAVENGITNGTSATTFGPESAVSRAQAVTFLWRAANAPAASGVSFDDVADGSYYAQAVAWAAQEGITSGTGGNSFSPDLIVSRAQAVTFLYRQHG